MASANWLPWALASAVFAALTAVFAKVGLQHVDSDLATLLRTIILVGVLGALVVALGKWQNPLDLPPRSVSFLVLSALATGASWLCYFRALQAGQASRVASVDKLSVVLVAAFATAFLGERLTAGEWIGILLIAGGVVVLSLRP